MLLPGALLLLAELTGVVLDPSGSAIPNAQVLLQESNGETRRTRTDVTGTFRFDRVAAGPSRIHVRQEGFDPAVLPVIVGGPAQAPLRITLAVSTLEADVTVSAELERISTDPGGNLDAVRFDREALDTLPVLDQDVIGAVSEFLDAGSVGSTGASVIVDGMETSEIGVSASAIQEVRINRNPYSAEFARPGGGRIEVTTKAGAPDYHGALNLQFRDHRLAARHAFATLRPEEQRRIAEGHLTGPVGRSKRTSFLVSAEREEQDQESVVYAVTPVGVVRENVPNPSRETEVSLRMDREMRPGQAIAVRYEFEQESERGAGAGGFRLPEAATDQSGREHHLYFSQRSILSDAWIAELSFRAGRHTEAEQARLSGSPRIVVLDAFTGGSAQTDRRQTETHLQLSGTLALSRGRHLVRTGVLVPEWSRHGLNDRSNFGGSFSFSSLEDFILGRPFAYTAQEGDSRLAFWQKEIAWFLQDDWRVRSNLSLGLGLRYDRQNFLNDRNNFAPRVSAAWSPGKAARTILRAGAGVFYDRTGDEPVSELLRYDGHRLREFAVSNPKYPDPGTLTEVPSNVVRFDRGLRSPYLLQYSFAVERRLGPSADWSATYTGIRGVKLFRSRNTNAPVGPFWLRPDASAGVVRQIESSAAKRARSLMLAVRGKVGPLLTGVAQYTLARAWNDTDGISSFPADHYNPAGEWSRASFDERHRLRLAGTLRAGKWFQIGVIFAAGSGRPYTMTTGRDDNRDTVAKDRPPGVARNTLEGPGAYRLDVRWSRKFSHDNGWAATLAVDAFNALNRVNYTQVVGNLSSPLFGRPVAAAPARRIQVGLRLEF